MPSIEEIISRAKGDDSSPAPRLTGDVEPDNPWYHVPLQALGMAGTVLDTLGRPVRTLLGTGDIGRSVESIWNPDQAISATDLRRQVVGDFGTEGDGFFRGSFNPADWDYGDALDTLMDIGVGTATDPAAWATMGLTKAGTVAAEAGDALTQSLKQVPRIAEQRGAQVYQDAILKGLGEDAAQQAQARARDVQTQWSRRGLINDFNQTTGKELPRTFTPEWDFRGTEDTLAKRLATGEAGVTVTPLGPIGHMLGLPSYETTVAGRGATLAKALMPVDTALQLFGDTTVGKGLSKTFGGLYEAIRNPNRRNPLDEALLDDQQSKFLLLANDNLPQIEQKLKDAGIPPEFYPAMGQYAETLHPTLGVNGPRGEVMRKQQEDILKSMAGLTGEQRAAFITAADDFRQFHQKALNLIREYNPKFPALYEREVAEREAAELAEKKATEESARVKAEADARGIKSLRQQMDEAEQELRAARGVSEIHAGQLDAEGRPVPGSSQDVIHDLREEGKRKPPTVRRSEGIPLPDEPQETWGQFYTRMSNFDPVAAEKEIQSLRSVPGPDFDQVQRVKELQASLREYRSLSTEQAATIKQRANYWTAHEVMQSIEKNRSRGEALMQLESELQANAEAIRNEATRAANVYAQGTDADLLDDSIQRLKTHQEKIDAATAQVNTWEKELANEEAGLIKLRAENPPANPAPSPTTKQRGNALTRREGLQEKLKALPQEQRDLYVVAEDSIIQSGKFDKELEAKLPADLFESLKELAGARSRLKSMHGLKPSELKEMTPEDIVGREIEASRLRGAKKKLPDTAEEGARFKAGAATPEERAARSIENAAAKESGAQQAIEQAQEATATQLKRVRAAKEALESARSEAALVQSIQNAPRDGDSLMSYVTRETDRLTEKLGTVDAKYSSGRVQEKEIREQLATLQKMKDALDRASLSQELYRDTKLASLQAAHADAISKGNGEMRKQIEKEIARELEDRPGAVADYYQNAVNYMNQLNRQRGLALKKVIRDGADFRPATQQEVNLVRQMNGAETEMNTVLHRRYDQRVSEAQKKLWRAQDEEFKARVNGKDTSVRELTPEERTAARAADKAKARADLARLRESETPAYVPSMSELGEGAVRPGAAPRIKNSPITKERWRYSEGELAGIPMTTRAREQEFLRGGTGIEYTGGLQPKEDMGISDAFRRLLTPKGQALAERAQAKLFNDNPFEVTRKYLTKAAELSTNSQIEKNMTGIFNGIRGPVWRKALSLAQSETEQGGFRSALKEARRSYKAGEAYDLKAVQDLEKREQMRRLSVVENYLKRKNGLRLDDILEPQVVKGLRDGTVHIKDALKPSAFPAGWQRVNLPSGKEMILPAAVADKYNRWMDASTARLPEYLNVVSQAIGPYMKVWRQIQTKVFPSFHIRNFMSDVFRMFQEGTIDGNTAHELGQMFKVAGSGALKDGYQGFKVWKNILVDGGQWAEKKFGQRMVSLDEVWHEAAAQNLIGTGQLAQVIEDSYTIAQKKSFIDKALDKAGAIAPGAADRVKGVVNAREDIERVAAMLTGLRQGKSAREAALRADEALFNFGHVGPLTKAIGRSGIVPFIAFTAKNLPAQVWWAIRNPGMAAAVYRTLDQMNQGSLPEHMLPQYMKDKYNMVVSSYKDEDGKIKYGVATADGLLPLADIGGLFQAGPIARTLYGLGEQINGQSKDGNKSWQKMISDVVGKPLSVAKQFMDDPERAAQNLVSPANVREIDAEKESQKFDRSYKARVGHLDKAIREASAALERAKATGEDDIVQQAQQELTQAQQAYQTERQKLDQDYHRNRRVMRRMAHLQLAP